MTTPPAKPQGETQADKELPEFIVSNQEATSTPQLEQDELSQTDQQEFLTLLSLGLVGGGFFVKGRLNVRFAHEHLKNIDVDKLLDLQDPAYYANVRQAHGMRTTFKDRHLLIGESGKYHMDEIELRRRSYALVASRKLRQEANDREINLRANRIAARYGLTPENNIKLNSEIREWMEKNPGKNLDDALITKATNLNLAQKTGFDVESMGEEARNKLKAAHKTELESSEKGYREDVKESRKKVIKSMEDDGTINRAKEVVNRTLDDKNPIPTPAQMNKEVNYIKTGQKPAPQPTPQPTQTQAVTTPSKQPQKPLPKPLPKVLKRVSIPGVDKIKTRIKQVIANSIIGRAYRAVAQKIAAVVAFFIAKKVAITAVWTGIKAAIAAAFGTVTAGIVTAIWGAYEAAKAIPIVGGFVGLPEKLAIDWGIKAGIFVVMCVVGLFVLVLFAPFIFTSMYSNPETYSIESDNSTKENTYDWKRFEGEFLSLDPNRHDDVEK